MSKSKVVLVTSAMLAGVALFGTVPTSAQSEASTAAVSPWEFWDTPDVVAYSLGVRTDADRERLLEAQVRATERLRDLGTREGDAAVAASPLRRAQAEFGRAVDELYAAATATKEAEQGREAWRECMATAGFSFDSPLALEKSIEEAAVAGMDAPLAGISANDRCHESTIRLLNPALRRLYPEWYEEQATVIAEYRSQLGL